MNPVELYIHNWNQNPEPEINTAPEVYIWDGLAPLLMVIANVAKNNLLDLQKCIDHKLQLLQNSPKHNGLISNQDLANATTEVVYKRGGKVRSMYTLQKYLSAGTDNTFIKEIQTIVNLYTDMGELSYEKDSDKTYLMNSLVNHLRQLQAFPEKQVEFYSKFYEMFISSLHNDELSHRNITPRDPNGDTGDTPRKEKIFKLWIDIINKINRGKSLEEMNDKARFTIFVDSWIQNIMDDSKKRVALGKNIAARVKQLQSKEILEDETPKYLIPEMSFEKYQGYYTDIKTLATDRGIANLDPALDSPETRPETFEIQYQDVATNNAKQIEDKEGWFDQRKDAQVELQKFLRSKKIELPKKNQVKILSQYDTELTWDKNILNIFQSSNLQEPQYEAIIDIARSELEIVLRIIKNYQESLAKSRALYSKTSFMQTNEHAFEIIRQFPLELQKVCVVNMEGEALRYEDFKDLL